jgi:hypothetical protein
VFAALFFNATHVPASRLELQNRFEIFRQAGKKNGRFSEPPIASKIMDNSKTTDMPLSIFFLIPCDNKSLLTLQIDLQFFFALGGCAYGDGFREGREVQPLRAHCWQQQLSRHTPERL